MQVVVILVSGLFPDRDTASGVGWRGRAPYKTTPFFTVTCAVRVLFWRTMSEGIAPGIDRKRRVSLVHAPTPLEPMRGLTKLLGGPEIWIKRDDCTGLALGGNKARKLEFLLAEARGQDADTIVTVGAAQSNHVRMTAAAARIAGMETISLLFPGAPGAVQGNLLLD